MSFWDALVYVCAFAGGVNILFAFTKYSGEPAMWGALGAGIGMLAASYLIYRFRRRRS